jgi:hypothetical protein
MFKLVSTTLAVVACAFSISAQAANPGENPSVITEWNSIAESQVPATTGPAMPRTYAIMHVAMFDAANSISGNFTPYRVKLKGANPYASTEAAAAQAAHDVLTALLPAGTAGYDSALNTRLATLNSTIDPQKVALGAQVGREVAAQILQWRSTDGFNLPQTFTPPAVPGVWRPTPPAFAPAGFVQAVDASPFALPRPYFFMPRRPPELDSQEYADGVNEIKTIGGLNSTVRTAEQTLQARLWASVNYKTQWAGVWNQVTRNTATQQGLPLIESARLFALVNTTMQDAVQTSMASKYAYSLWRPVHAIQLADTDSNPGTDADPSWMPLLTTPPYPSYAGNMACIGAGVSRTLQLYYGTDAMPVSVTWEGINGNTNVTRNFTGFNQLSEHQAVSREYGGIHFHFDTTASQEVCPLVANYVYGNFMRPIKK